MSATADLFLRGAWIKVPTVDFNGTRLVVTGNWLRVAAPDGEDCPERELEDPEGCIRTLKDRRSHNVRADVLTFAQMVPSTEPQYPFPMQRDSIATIRLTSFNEWWERLPQETRKNARRAAKRGVVVSVRALDDNLIRQIMEINNETPSRQGRRFTHYGESFEDVKRDFSSFAQRSEFACAYLGDELIGISKIVYCGDVAVIMKLQPKISHYDKKPANALLCQALECCALKGVSHVTYGKYRYGRQEHTSLMEFKARHGFEEVLVPRFYVPLTAKGRVAVNLGLHRDMVEVLPASVIRVARSVRKRWHTRGLSAGVAQR
jgi:hypothetical protein